MLTSHPWLMLAVMLAMGLAILVEALWRWRKNRDLALEDMISGIGIGGASQLVAVYLQVPGLLAYDALWQHARWLDWDTNAPALWLGTLLLYDFCYYWLHRAGHQIHWLWALHGVHHQGELYHLAAGLRQSLFSPLVSWLFYLPLALLGVPPSVFMVIALVHIAYQFWIHTEAIGRLGWIDQVFVTPENHRIHHASDDVFLDKNYGGMLIIWDKLFGTYAQRQDNQPLTYGTRSPLRSFSLWDANLQIWRSLLRQARALPRWRQRWQLLWLAPGWWPAQTVKPHADETPWQAGAAPFRQPQTAAAQAFLLWQLAGLLLIGWVSLCITLPLHTGWQIALHSWLLWGFSNLCYRIGDARLATQREWSRVALLALPLAAFSLIMPDWFYTAAFTTPWLLLGGLACAIPAVRLWLLSGPYSAHGKISHH